MAALLKELVLSRGLTLVASIETDPEKIKTFEEFMFHNTYEYERTKPSFKLILTES